MQTTDHAYCRIEPTYRIAIINSITVTEMQLRKVKCSILVFHMWYRKSVVGSTSVTLITAINFCKTTLSIRVKKKKLLMDVTKSRRWKRKSRCAFGSVTCDLKTTYLRAQLTPRRPFKQSMHRRVQYIPLPSSYWLSPLPPVFTLH